MDLNEQARKPAIGDFRFTTEYTPDKDDPGKMKGTDKVSWIKIGDQMHSRTSEAIDRLRPRPDKRRPASLEWALIEPYYEAWKKGQAMPETGTPLAAWPGCDHALSEALIGRGVRTVEDFAAMADHYLGNIPVPDARRRQAAARAFLDAQQGNSHVAAELSKRDETIERLTRQIEEQGKMLETLTTPKTEGKKAKEPA